MAVQRPADDLGLARHPLGIQAGARSREQRRFRIEQGAGQRRRRGRVAYAHFAADEKPGVAEPGAFGCLPAGMQGARELRLRHGRFVAEVGGAGSEGEVQHAVQGAGVVHRPQVDHFQFRPEFAGQHADGGAAAGEVFHHLGGHRLGKGRDPIGGHAVIGGEHGDVHRVCPGALRALQRRQPDGDFFEPPQGTGRLGEVRLARLSGAAGAVVRRGRGHLQPFGGFVHEGSPSNAGAGRPSRFSRTRRSRCVSTMSARHSMADSRSAG